MSSQSTGSSPIDVTSDTFAEQVLARSRSIPVLVDFWAAWCGPCRVLGPVLEKLAREMEGAFVLAKVDTDASPDLSQRYGIRGIPAVKLFVEGEVVDEFVGALPPDQVRAFLRRHCPTEADRRVESGRALLGAGELEPARAVLAEALALDPQHFGARLALAEVAVTAGDADAARTELDAIPMRAPESDAAEGLRAVLGFLETCREAGGEGACRQALGADPDDLESRYALGCCLEAAGRHEEALEELLAVVARDKRFRDEAARKAMVTIFGRVGIHSPLSDAFRRRLAIYL